MPTTIPLYSPIWSIALFLVSLLTVGLVGRCRAFKLPDYPANKRLGELDGFRGVLAFGVFVTHAATTYVFRTSGTWTWPNSSFYTMCGHFPVALFFMITGFLFWRRSILRKQEWGDFFVSRVLRLLPLYVVATMVLMVYVGMLTRWRFNESSVKIMLEVLQWMAMGVLGRPDVNGLAHTTVINTATWTLREETLFYLSLPLLAFFATGPRFLLLCTVLTPAFLWRAEATGGRIWLHFLFGMATAHLHVRFPRVSFFRSGAAAGLCLAILAAAWAAGLHQYELLNAAVAFPLFVCVVYGNPLFGLLRIREVRWLGEISYSIYLLHCLVLFGMFWLFDELIGVQSMTPIVYWGGCAIVLVVVIILSTITFLKIERPFMQQDPRKVLKYLYYLWRRPKQTSEL